MFTKLVESTVYPYLNVILKIDNFEKKELAFADTGAEVNGIFIPKKLIDFTKIKQISSPFVHKLPNGKPLNCEIYEGKITIGKKDFMTSVVISEEFEEVILGRGILDRVKSCFDGVNNLLTIYVFS